MNDERKTRTLTGPARWTVTEEDHDYPECLIGHADAPEVIYGYGNREALTNLDRDFAVGIVGARRASAYGREVAYSLGNELSSTNYTVVSGMQLGIDGAAHRGALQAGVAPTIAVIGTGPDVAYPRSHRLLHERIVQNGCVLSVQPFGSEQTPESREAAKLLIATLTGLTVFAEGSTTSGAMDTLGYSVAFGGKIGAVPGPVTGPMSDGPNSMLKQGAYIITDADDARNALI